MRRREMVLDPVKYETFYQKLDKILNEGKEVIRYLSAGTITRESGEVQEAIYLPNGEAAHVAAGILMHIMNVTRVIRYMNAEKYADDIGIYDGDEFINNDAYIGGMHNPDTATVVPIFHGDKLIAYAAAISHTTEVGAIEMGGMCPLATEAVHDGIHLPATKLVERGKMRRDVFNLILRAVRDPTAVELDIRARLAGNERTKRRIKELVDEFGLPFFEAALRQLVDDAEEFTRARIKSLRPGIYRARGYDENSGLRERLATVEIEVEITEAGDLLIRIPVVSPQDPGFNNAYIPAVEAWVFVMLLQLLLYDCRWNGGLARAIKIDQVPEKSRLNASADASVGCASVGIANVFADAFTVALSRALYAAGKLQDVMGPSTSSNCTIAGGTSQYGAIAVQVITSSGIMRATGGRVDKDGIDSSVTTYNPWTYISDVESEETLLPIMHLARAHRPDTGGFGKFRGGTGAENVTMIYDSKDMTMNHYGSSKRIPENQGLFGGYPGSASFFDWMLDTNIAEVIAKGGKIPAAGELLTDILKGDFRTGPLGASSGNRKMKTGDFMDSTTNAGGGGLGDPIERDPALVVKDIENKVASLEAAQKVYAVSINPETLEVDYGKTQKLRAERRKERLAQGMPGIKYLAQLAKAREERRLSGVAQGFHDETREFCQAYEKEIQHEKELIKKGLQPIGKVNIREQLFSLTPYIDIAVDDKGRKLAVCSQCGFAYCEANDNFKLYTLIYDRDPSYFHPGRLSYDKEWCTFREFYCPSCAAQIEVEGTVPGSPILNDYSLKL
jgi:N-methylhydantoinase B